MAEEDGETEAGESIRRVFVYQAGIGLQKARRLLLSAQSASFEEIGFPRAQYQRHKIGMPRIYGPKNRGRTIGISGGRKGGVREQGRLYPFLVALADRIEKQGAIALR